MAMSNRRILSAMCDDTIVIDPFIHNNLSTSSYDVRLGEFYYSEQSPALEADIFNIYNPDQVERVWGSVCRAEPAKDQIDLEICQRIGLDPEALVIMIEPGETILGHTEEFIGGRDHITTMMKARSSLGRSFITVCKCAGWGDVGYVNRWTMEITNVSRYYAIPLLVGSRIAQIVFMETGQIVGADYSKDGAYQNAADLETLKREWKPEAMLPRNRP